MVCQKSDKLDGEKYTARGINFLCDGQIMKIIFVHIQMVDKIDKFDRIITSLSPADDSVGLIWNTSAVIEERLQNNIRDSV